MFDKKKIPEKQWDYLEPFVEEYLTLAKSTNNINELNTVFIEKIHELHFKIVDEANDHIKNNKFKFGAAGMGANPYGRIKVEKLPVPNLYSVLLFSNLWTSKIVGVFGDEFCREYPELSKNEEGDTDKEIAFNKIHYFFDSFAEHYFDGRAGKKRLKEWKEYMYAPLGNKMSIMATFYLFPKGVLESVNTLYEELRNTANK